MMVCLLADSERSWSPKLTDVKNAANAEILQYEESIERRCKHKKLEAEQQRIPADELQSRNRDLETRNDMLTGFLENAVSDKHRFRKKYDEARRDNENLKKEYHKLLSIGIVRGQVEDIEEDMSRSFEFPSHMGMIHELKRDGNWEYGEKNESQHYVKFYYYVKKSRKPLAAEILTLLRINNAPLHEFCEAVAELYQKTCHRIHNTEENLTLDEIRTGLVKNGLSKRSLLDSVSIIYQIHHRPLSSGQGGASPAFDTSSVSTNVSSISTNVSSVSTNAPAISRQRVHRSRSPHTRRNYSSKHSSKSQRRGDRNK